MYSSYVVSIQRRMYSAAGEINRISELYRTFCLAAINTAMTKNEEIKKSTQEWMFLHASHFTHAVTLTLKPYREVMTCKGLTIQRLTEIEAKENFRQFIRRLNTIVYGNAAKRFSAGVHVIPVIEGVVTEKLLHYHCMMGNFRAGSDDALIAYFGERDRRFRERDRFGWLGRCAVSIVDFLVSSGRVRAPGRW
ncbi:hypothetical protein, partial [Burkholderia vietnamiensis]|uniref:hypothetical protein n=1 Tax=Burkholderia vietnamiensis TaxID=60552 RepID=UPI002011874B